MIRRILRATIVVIAVRAAALAEPPPPEEPRTHEPGHPGAERHLGGAHWGWRLDHGLHYLAEWVPPRHVLERDQVLGRALDERVAIDGMLTLRLQADAAAYRATGGLDPPTADAEIRRLVLGTTGTFTLLLHIGYAATLELNGDDLDFGDAYLVVDDVPWIRRIRVGNFDPAQSLEALTSSRDTLFMERAAPIEALAPGRKAGLEIGGPLRNHPVTWSLGVFGSKQGTDVGDQSKGAGRLVGRVSWLVEDAPARARLTHLGVGASAIFAAESIRYRSRPESHLVPQLVDTGDLVAGAGYGMTLEYATIRGPWTASAEWIASTLNVDTRRVFHGGYVSLARFLTSDTQAYDRAQGKLGRIIPTRDASWRAHTLGALRLGGRVSYLDLDDGTLNAGRQVGLTTGLAWHLNRFLVVRAEYVIAFVEGGSNSGTLHGLQMRIQFDWS